MRIRRAINVDIFYGVPSLTRSCLHWGDVSNSFLHQMETLGGCRLRHYQMMTEVISLMTISLPTSRPAEMCYVLSPHRSLNHLLLSSLRTLILTCVLMAHPSQYRLNESK